MMNIEEIKSNLCNYDPRNPDRSLLDEYPPMPRKDCACDNCFYGRTKMADAMLKLIEGKDEALSRLDKVKMDHYQKTKSGTDREKYANNAVVSTLVNVEIMLKRLLNLPTT